MIEEQYVSFETAKLAKEKGFDIPTRYGFSERGTLVRVDTSDNWNQDKGFYSRPTQSLLARWLREDRHMCVEVYCIACNFIWNICKTDGTDTKSSEYSGPNDGGAWDSYEDAMENGLQEALKMIG